VKKRQEPGKRSSREKTSKVQRVLSFGAVKKSWEDMLTKLDTTQTLRSCVISGRKLTREPDTVTHLAVDWGRSVKADEVEDCSHEGGHARE